LQPKFLLASSDGFLSALQLLCVEINICLLLLLAHHRQSIVHAFEAVGQFVQNTHLLGMVFLFLHGTGIQFRLIIFHVLIDDIFEDSLPLPPALIGDVLVLCQ
jgi:hypothetical protein